MKTIAFTGPKGIGKSTAAHALSETHTRMSFADPIYDAVSAILGRDARAIEDKEAPLPEFGERSLRYVLQTLGTDWGRDTVHRGVWINHMKRRILAHDGPVVIDDLRFPDEEEMLKRMGALIIRITGHHMLDVHASETSHWQIRPHHTLVHAEPRDWHWLKWAVRQIAWRTEK